MQALPSPLTFRRSGHSLSFSSQDLARYLCEVIRDMEQPGGGGGGNSDGDGDNHVAGAMTTPRRKQRSLVSVRSLSSLSDGQGVRGSSEGDGATGARGGARQQSLGKLDRFKTLRAVVGELRGGGGRGGGAGGGAGEASGRCRSPGSPQREKLREGRVQLNCEKSG